MPIEILPVSASAATAASIARAAQALRTGGLVIFPTETVYGVAANAADPGAVARLRAAKGRGDSQPFTVHLGRRADARRYLTKPSPLVRRLARKAWPGPMTLVCDELQPAETEVGRALPAAQLTEIYHDRSVGLRVPDHPATIELLSSVDAPIVASSANRAGKPPPLDINEAIRELGEEADVALDGGRTRYSAASTIVRVRGNQWSVARTGVMDERTIRRMATSEYLFVCSGNSCRSPLAEHLFRHKLAERLHVSAAELSEMGYVVTSAGTSAWPGGAMSAGSRDELARRGIDGSSHRSQPLTVELIQRAERIYAMSPEHLETVIELVPAAVGRAALLDPSGPVTDPVGGSPADYRECAAHIEKALDARLEELLHEDLDW